MAFPLVTVLGAAPGLIAAAADSCSFHLRWGLTGCDARPAAA